MSEYWVSHKKYFCKFCNIYIADDAPSRQHHENGFRHKGNKERFVRSLYKAGEKRKKDLEEEKHEMVRVEQAARAAFAQDVGAGHAKHSDSSAGPSLSTATQKPPPPKPSNPFANYSTAASLGYADPDAERLTAEAERRRTQGVVGNWEFVTPSQGEAASSSNITDESLKREAEQPVDDERHFKLRKKTLDVGLGDIYDPGVIPIKLKKKEPSPTPLSDQQDRAETATSSSKLTGVPKWTKVQWKRPGEGAVEESNSAQASEPKQEGVDSQIKDEPTPSEESVPVKTESTEPTITLKTETVPALTSEPSGLFKKRRRPVR